MPHDLYGPIRRHPKSHLLAFHNYALEYYRFAGSDNPKFPDLCGNFVITITKLSGSLLPLLPALVVECNHTIEIMRCRSSLETYRLHLNDSGEERWCCAICTCTETLRLAGLIVTDRCSGSHNAIFPCPRRHHRIRQTARDRARWQAPPYC